MIINFYNQGGGGSGSGMTPQQVQQQIDTSLNPYWDSGETKDYVDEAVSGISLEGYYTSAQTEEAIISKGYASQDQVDEIDEVVAESLNDLQAKIDELSGATPSIDLSGYYTSAQTEERIASAYTILDEHITEVERVTSSAYTELHDDIIELSARTIPDMSLYTPTSGFSTINGSAITAGGNLVIQGGSASGGSLPVGYEAADHYGMDENYQIVTVDGKLFGDNLYNMPGFHYFEDGYSDEERGYVAGACDIFGYYDEDENFVPVFLPAGTYAILNTDEDDIEKFGKVMNLFYGKVGDEDVIYNDVDYVDFYPSLISPLFTITEPTCPTTNGGYYTLDLDYTDKPSAQSQIDTLDEVVAESLNDLNERVTVLEVSGGTPSVDLSGYYTSAQTEDAISAATSGKADAANVTANNGGLKFPLWNTQGVITGLASSNSFRQEELKLNGSNYYVVETGTKVPPIYAPTTSGNPGDILVSSGNGAPVWSAVTIPDMSEYYTSAQTNTAISAATQNMVTSTTITTMWRGTQAAYDTATQSGATADPNTFYIILPSA